MSATAPGAPAPRPLRSAALVRAFAPWPAAQSTGTRLLAEVRGLEALSDTELARRGLSRDRIVARVFAPYFGH